MNVIATIADFGRLLRDERKRQGLRQDELAAAANVGVRFIVELEAGKPTVQLGKALTVAQALGMRLTLSDTSRPESQDK